MVLTSQTWLENVTQPPFVQAVTLNSARMCHFKCIYCRNVEVTHKKYTTRSFLERSYRKLGLCFINCRHKIMFKNKKNILKKLKESVI